VGLDKTLCGIVKRGIGMFAYQRRRGYTKTLLYVWTHKRRIEQRTDE
jgi:hypothetical protein